MARPKKSAENRSDTVISMRIPSKLKAKMKELAAREHRSFSAQVIVAIEQHMAEKC